MNDQWLGFHGYEMGGGGGGLLRAVYHRPYNWGPNSVFPAILVTRDA